MVRNAIRYKGSDEDERRLFYVALTRAEKYLFCSWAPITSNKQQRSVSKFFGEFTSNGDVLTKEPKAPALQKVEPRRRQEELFLAISFSELKYYFECPYLFKLRFQYGFDTPVSRALGYGKSLHDALAQIHAESLRGDIPAEKEVSQLVKEHLHLPFSNRQVEENLRRAATKALARYLRDHREDLDKLEHVEKVVELKLGGGIVVNGRIDLIRRTDTDEVVIVDFKSDERAQAEDVTKKQLQVYAVGYQQLTGQNADLIEVHNLDRGGAKREVVDEDLIRSTTESIVKAGQSFQQNHLPRLKTWGAACASCDMACICRRREGPAPRPRP